MSARALCDGVELELAFHPIIYQDGTIGILIRGYEMSPHGPEPGICRVALELPTLSDVSGLRIELGRATVEALALRATRTGRDAA